MLDQSSPSETSQNGVSDVVMVSDMVLSGFWSPGTVLDQSPSSDTPQNGVPGLGET